MAQVQSHYEVVMSNEEEPMQCAPSIFVFRMLQQQLRYNHRLLEQLWLVKGQIIGEQVNEDVVAAMVRENQGFPFENRTMY